MIDGDACQITVSTLSISFYKMLCYIQIYFSLIYCQEI